MLNKKIRIHNRNIYLKILSKQININDNIIFFGFPVYNYLDQITHDNIHEHISKIKGW